MSSDNAKKSSFRFEGYLIKKTSLELKSKDFDHNYHLNIRPNGTLDEEKKQLTIELDVTVHDTHKKLNLNFIIEGAFRYESESFEELAPYISINGPAILFPYVRAYVSNITALSGCSPVIMPTLNMESTGDILLNILRNKITQAAK